MANLAAEIIEGTTEVRGPNITTLRSDVTTLQNGWAAGMRSYSSRAAMDADLSPGADTLAFVWKDPISANIGVWAKIGASETGSWEQSPYDRVAQLEAEVDALEPRIFESAVPWYYPELAVLGKDANGSLRVLLAGGQDGGEVIHDGESLGEIIARTAGLEARAPAEAPWYYPDNAVAGRDANGVLRALSVGGMVGAANFATSNLRAPTAWDILVVAGQSNATDTYGDAALSVTPRAGTAYYWTGTAWAALGARKGFWSSLARAYHRDTGRGVLLVPVAISATSITTWAGPGTTSYDAAIAKIDAALTNANADATRPPAYGTTHRVMAWVWLQGESDQSMTEATYRGHFDTMLSALYTKYGDNLRACLLGLALYSGNPVTGPRDAQRAAARTDARLFWGWYSGEQFTARGLMADTAHYTQAGYNLVGESAGRTLARVGLWNL